jgi:tRNA(Ile)-lysidine synthase TilS/MesJ
MTSRASVRGIEIVRPLLNVRRATLRAYLVSRGLSWREDASNASFEYGRNVARAALAGREELAQAMLDLATSCARLRDWTETVAPTLNTSFATRELADLPAVVARRAATKWMTERGVPPDQVEPAAIERLLEMCRDAATPAQVNLPGNRRARRRAGRVFIEWSPPALPPRGAS